MEKTIEEVLIDFMFGEDKLPMPQNYYVNIFKPKLDQATLAIKTLLKEKMLKEKKYVFASEPVWQSLNVDGYNQAIDEMKEIISTL